MAPNLDPRDAVSRYAGALFEDDMAFARAMEGLDGAGVDRSAFIVAARNARQLLVIADRYGLTVTKSALRESGLVSELARIAGRDEGVDHKALRHELVERGIDVARAQTFDERLVGSKLLLLVPAGQDATVFETLADSGADLGFAHGSGLLKTILLRSETIDVVKRLVVDAEVIVRTDVIVERKTFDIELTREELVVERTDRTLDGAPIELIRIPLKHDEAIIDKQTIVTSEVVVRTEFHVDSSVVTDTLRHEVLVVDDPRTPTPSIT